MISFGQVLILILLVVLLFGDSRQIFNKAIVFFVNIKTLLKKISSVENKNKDSTKH